jgi:hypothetical protein
MRNAQGLFDDPFRRPGEISVPRLPEAPKFSSQGLDLNGLVSASKFDPMMSFAHSIGDSASSASKFDPMAFAQSLGDPRSLLQMGSPDENYPLHHEAPLPSASASIDERLVETGKPMADLQPSHSFTYPESRNESLVEEQSPIPPIPTAAPAGVDTEKIKELASTWWDFSDLNRTGFLTFPDVACIVRQLHYTFGATAPDAPSLRGIIKQYCHGSTGSEDISKSDFLIMYLNMVLAETNAMLPRKD